MPYFAVVREQGPAWNYARDRREQSKWDEHAGYMDALEADGFFLFAGPLDGGPRILSIVDAPDPATIRRWLDDDPWTPMGLLRIVSIEPWDALVGGGTLDRMRATAAERRARRDSNPRSCG